MCQFDASSFLYAAPEFLSLQEIGDYIYLLFRELADEEGSNVRKWEVIDFGNPCVLPWFPVEPLCNTTISERKWAYIEGWP